MRGAKLKKTIAIVLVSIILFGIMVILFISPLTKYAVEKYDRKYTGREIKLDWVYVNPFTGYFYFRNIKIYESNGDSVFFSANKLGINFSLTKLFSKTYEINTLSIDQPWIVITQHERNFNFDDILEKFTPEKSDVPKAPLHFNLLNVKINNGEVHYKEQIIPVNYFIKKINFESPGKKWNIDTVSGKISFLTGAGSGNIKSNFSVNLNTLEYRLTAEVRKFDMELMNQYLKELANYGSVSATVDANIWATGNLKNKEDLNANGLLVVNDFHFGKNPKEDYLSYDKLVLKINELSPKNHKYVFDSVSLFHPFFKYEKYDYLNNVETMFGKKGANVKVVAENPERYNLIIETVRYVKVLAKNFFKSNYKIKRLAIYKGDIKFNDYSLSEKFSAGLSPFNILADSINKDRQRVEVVLKSGIQPYGHMSITLSINPKDSSDFEMFYHFQKISAPMFNPYLISYTSFPLDRGSIELNGKWNVRNGIIKSDNHLLLLDPRETKRIKNKGTRWIPMSLIMSLVRERSNVIDYEIPITGDLKNPKFHLHDMLFDLLGNIFIKPPTTPYRMEVRNIEEEIEKSLTLKWRMRQFFLFPSQKRFVKKMADFLVENPDANIIVHPIQYMEKEKEYILFFEAKKKYFLMVNHQNTKYFDEADSMKVEKMSVKDSLFVRYLDKQFNNALLFTIQEKCLKYIDSNMVSYKFRELIKKREKEFISYFKERSVENQIKIYAPENNIPFNGFSFYKINYKGEFPKHLIKAYADINELNNELPRKKFKKIRERTKEGF